MKQKLEKWDRWLEAILKEVQNLVLYQFVYRDLQSMIDNNKDLQKPSPLFDCEIFRISL